MGGCLSKLVSEGGDFRVCSTFEAEKYPVSHTYLEQPPPRKKTKKTYNNFCSTLFPEEYPEKNLEFMKKTGIQHFQIGMPGNKEPFVNSKISLFENLYFHLSKNECSSSNSILLSYTVPNDRVERALRVVLDRRNHPVLIHCNKGKVRGFKAEIYNDL